MGTTLPCTYGLPCISKNENHTKTSIVLRVTTVVAGALLLLVGTLALLRVGALVALNRPGSWGILTSGAFVCCMGIFLKWVGCSRAEAPVLSNKKKSIPYLSNVPIFLEKFLKDAPLQENVPFNTRYLDQAVKSPVAIYYGKDNLGNQDLAICFRLHIQYLPPKNQEEYNGSRPGSTPLSTSPASLFVIAYKQPHTDKWFLSVKNDNPVLHRGKDFYPSQALTAHDFSFSYSSGDDFWTHERINRLIETKRQIDLPEDEQTNLAWVLLRLLAKGCLKMRESAKNTDEFKDPSYGDWLVTIDKGSLP